MGNKNKLMQTTAFYSKKQSLTRATKSHKKIHEHHRTNCFWQNNTFKNLGAQEEAKYGEENCKKTSQWYQSKLTHIKTCKSEELGPKNQASSAQKQCKK